MKESYKTKMEPHKTKISQSLSALRTRQIQKTGMLHKIPDYENRDIYMVDDDGNIIHSRKMKPEERQYTIKPAITKTA